MTEVLSHPQKPHLIQSDSIFLKVGQANIDGKDIRQSKKCPDKELNGVHKKKLKKSTMTADEFLQMRAYAKHLPRGKRELKLDYSKLRDMLLSENTDTPEDALTKTAGHQRGGKVAIEGNLKSLSQKDHIITIKNNNRLPWNPDYPYWRNNYKLK